MNSDSLCEEPQKNYVSPCSRRPVAIRLQEKKRKKKGKKYLGNGDHRAYAVTNEGGAMARGRKANDIPQDSDER
jgi:hypothetical protein